MIAADFVIDSLLKPKLENGCRLIRRFMPPEEAASWLGFICSREELFQPVSSKAGMNLPYHVLHGANIRAHLPELLTLASTRLLQAAQEAVGERLELMHDPVRSVRIQYYRAKSEGFKWHLDGGKYSALLTLVNTNQGATEVISPAWSRVLFPFPYLLFYWFQGVFKIAKPTPLIAGAGDLLLIHGRKIVHRGTTGLEKGERMVLVATFNPVGTKPTPLWDRFARWLNY